MQTLGGKQVWHPMKRWFINAKGCGHNGDCYVSLWYAIKDSSTSCKVGKLYWMNKENVFIFCLYLVVCIVICPLPRILHDLTTSGILFSNSIRQSSVNSRLHPMMVFKLYRMQHRPVESYIQWSFPWDNPST